MSECLSIEYDSGRKALVTHSLGERFMVRAIIVNLISEFLEGYAILAFLVWLVLSLALLLYLNQVMLKTFVLELSQSWILSLNAINALLIGAMLALFGFLFHIFLGHPQAVDTLCVRTVTTVMLFHLIICQWLWHVLLRA
jgi:hypothetical protein